MKQFYLILFCLVWAGSIFASTDAEKYISSHSQIFKKNSPEVLTQLKNEVSDNFALDIINTWSKQLFAKIKTCQTVVASCDFYLCQEKANPCGLEGYNLGYGYKYCSKSRFKLLDQMKSISGKKWVTDVITCLQKKNFEDSKKLASADSVCQDIEKEAINSHADCYVQSGFCNLKLSEKLKIINTVKKEILTPNAVFFGTYLLLQCGENI